MTPPAEDVYRVPAWARFDWLVHGFGTRRSKWDADQLTTVRQIHSARVISAHGRTGNLGEGDALVSDSSGVTLAVKTADCVPLLLVDPVHRAVAAIHAGWRGTAQQIGAATVALMAERFHTAASDLHAAIGPGIGKCCYEVGPEVAREFPKYVPMAEMHQRTHLDLAGINQAQLIEAGVSPDHIYDLRRCTACHPEEFCSWRRERETAGRMFSVIGIK